MRYLSVCSGIEAATVAWHPLGWQAAAYSEIEAFPRSVLKHHYPEVPLHGDFTTIKGNEYGAVDLLVGGTPCQSFSVAGLRKGLDDPRGNLMLEYGALAKRLSAKWLVWENVPGVLSSNGGRDFAAFLGMLAELGYGFAYRVLDAQYFGVAQRRRRVFVVGYLGNWRPAAAVLFERHSLSGHPAPSRQSGKGYTYDLAPCLTSSGRGVERTGETRGQDPVVAVAAPVISHCLNAGGMGRIDYETETMIVHPVAHIDVMPTMVSGGSTAASHNQMSGQFREEYIVPTTNLRVRRLMPPECEALQGFPRNYTLVPVNKRGKMAADGPRYKALGNSMAVPVMHYIGKRLDQVDGLLSLAQQ